MGVLVGVAVGGTGVFVGVGGTGVNVAVATGVSVGVGGIGVKVAVAVFVGVGGTGVFVAVGVSVGVAVGGTGVSVGVLVGVAVGGTGVLVEVGVAVGATSLGSSNTLPILTAVDAGPPELTEWRFIISPAFRVSVLLVSEAVVSDPVITALKLPKLPLILLDIVYVALPPGAVFTRARSFLNTKEPGTIVLELASVLVQLRLLPDISV